MSIKINNNTIIPNILKDYRIGLAATAGTIFSPYINMII